MSRFTSWPIPLVVLGLFLMQGCGSAPTRLDAVPLELTAQAEIPGMPGVRYVAGGDMTELFQVVVAADVIEHGLDIGRQFMVVGMDAAFEFHDGLCSLAGPSKSRTVKAPVGQTSTTPWSVGGFL